MPGIRWHRLLARNRNTLLVSFAILALATPLAAQELCPRPQPGAVVQEPPDRHSTNGVLELTLTAHDSRQPNGTTRYCYVDERGNESPNLRVNPGDEVIIHLRNSQKGFDHTSSGAMAMPMPHAASARPSCTASTAMTLLSTNLHFHGMTIPASCHQDDVLGTLVEPDEGFEYRFRVPEDEPPGLYWYHPHIHGFSQPQMLGGASGALIVEGTERQKPELAGLPERVLIIRDQDLMHPSAPPSPLEPKVPQGLIDSDGDAANTGTGFGKPAKDLSINYVPAPYPDYPPGIIRTRPAERQLWRVLNAAALTYLNIEVLFNNAPQRIGLVAMDGVPINQDRHGEDVIWQTHFGIPPGARVEFVVQTPPAGVAGLLVTRSVDTGPGGENDPNRALASIVSTADAPEPRVTLAQGIGPAPAPKEPWLGEMPPVRVRHLYFSEKLANPNDPTSAVEFYITVEGQKPKAFSMADPPEIVAQQGTVEDWIIENRTRELHAFHIHQIHFLLLQYAGLDVRENFLRDTVNVPFMTGRLLTYPSVRVRMDFRDPNIIGVFPYHCHLLEHEDKGMMGTIEVDPRSDSVALVNAGNARSSSGKSK